MSEYEMETEFPEETIVEPKPLVGVPLIWSAPSISGAGACARGGHSSVVCGNLLVVFGGQYYDGSKGEGEFIYLNDLHTLNLETLTWSIPKVSGDIPEGRYGHSAHLCGDRMFLFGGRGKAGKLFKNVYFLDTRRFVWVQVDTTTDKPRGRMNHASCLVGSKVFMHGGWDGKVDFGDAWVFDTDAAAWIKPKVAGSAPGPRHGHTMNLTEDGRILVFGGYSVKEGELPKYNADLRELDIETMIWSRSRALGDYPTGRFGHTAVIAGKRLFLFGGWSGQARCRLCNAVLPPSGSKKLPADVHQPDCIIGTSMVGYEAGGDGRAIDYLRVLDTDTMEWSAPALVGPLPESRFGHTTTQVGLHLLLFGGWDATRPLKDIVALQIAEL